MARTAPRGRPAGTGTAAAHGKPPTRAQRYADESHDVKTTVVAVASETVTAPEGDQGPRGAYSSSNSAWDIGMARPQLLGVSP